MDWIFLILSSLCTVTAFTFLRLSENFTKIYPSILTFLFIALNIVFFSLAIQTIDIGIAYTAACGLGTLLTTSTSIIWFAESADFGKIMAIIVIVLGVALLKIT
ncbi:MAG: SMR family transporter [Oscillatoria sp. PMC 1051.18]|nr:SMR family transporter [Oscillatoria sp. PMC 1050.18]MEC5030011.1 SMR family transporter [Oscillatoria sp. PMC 1051.18]